MGSDRRASEFPGPLDRLPDARDGLTRIERVVLHTLQEAQAEMGGRHVPTLMLYGRVVERVNISKDELQSILQRFSGAFSPPPRGR